MVERACHCRAQAFGHAFGGAAGGGGQGDARGGGRGGLCLRDAQQQQARDGGGLAGAGAAGDQQQGAAQGECGGLGLVVVGGDGDALTLTRASGALTRGEKGSGCVREQRREQRCQSSDGEGRQRLRGEAAQALREAALVFAVAAQVEQAVFQHQRAVGGRRFFGGGLGDPARGGQGALPVGGIREVRRRAVAWIEQDVGAGRVQAGMAAGDGERGQGGGGQDQIGGGWVQAAQGLGEGVVERAQGATAVQGG